MYLCKPLYYWRDVRVVEGNGLENRRAGNGTEGSNPSLSANSLTRFVRVFELVKCRLMRTTWGSAKKRAGK